MPYQIDDIDRMIVCLLQEDGRMASAEIARRVGNITERVARFRINRLIEDGVIKVSAIVKPEAIGYFVTADVWVEVESGQVLKVADKLKELEEVSYIACSTGDKDISMQVVAHSNVELYRFVTDVIGNVPGVKKASMVFIPLVIKDVYDWRIPSPHKADEQSRKEGGA